MLEQRKLSEGMFAQIRRLLKGKRLLLKSGTTVGATIIAAPPSPKNAAGAREPETHQTKKGKDGHFAMKGHVSTDRRGIVHNLTTTAANVRESARMSKVLHGHEREVLGDHTYWNESHRHASCGAQSSGYQRWTYRLRSRAQAQCEHILHVVKHLRGYGMVRHRGLAKNTCRLCTTFTLAILDPLRRRLLPAQVRCLWCTARQPG